MSENRDLRRLNRRDFVRVTTVAASALASGSLLSACADDSLLVDPEAGAGDSLAKRTAVTRNPLKIPDVMAPTDLTAAPSLVDIGGGEMVEAWAYNGQFPGPTLVASNGDSVSLKMTNGLQDETIIHWHGMIVEREDDGHPQDVVDPGGDYDYDFVVNQRAALNWYHPHPDMLTGEQVNMGLAGAFIIRDDEEDALGLPSGKYEVPLIIRDATIRGGRMTYRARKSGFFGKTPLVNGTRNPKLEVDPAVYRFRVLNGANARHFNLSLSNGQDFILIGNDGGLLPMSHNLGQILMSPGERIDILVDFQNLQGTSLMLHDLEDGWDLLEFNVNSESNIGYAFPEITTSTIPELSEADVVQTRVFSFDGMSKINGRVYGMERIDEYVPKGQTEKWIFTTGGSAPHPVHVHAAPFKVLSRTGGRGEVFPWETGLKDTVLLEDGETVEVLIRFDDFAGLFLLHCHKLEHEDAGMMMNFEVVDPT
jgi:FtsP/CotA-like multicopper oxidase with cupredoxin domain